MGGSDKQSRDNYKILDITLQEIENNLKMKEVADKFNLKVEDLNNLLTTLASPTNMISKVFNDNEEENTEKIDTSKEIAKKEDKKDENI